MAAAPVKSQPLHYFSLSHLKWGNKSHTTNTNHRFRRRNSPSSTTDLNGGSPQKQPEEKQTGEEHEQEEEEKVGCEEGEVRLWNLRPRKGVMKHVLECETTSLKKVEMGVENIQRSSMRHGVGSDKKKLWISLSREEIEEDVYSMTGSRPCRRPKKRSKTIQKQLDNCFPGLYLVGLTADAFRVHDTTK